MGRWALVFASACGAATLSCGGEAFTTGGPGNDAGVSGRTTASDGSMGGLKDASVVDAAAVDASDPTLSSDAAWMPDVLEAPPAHCQGAFACTAAVPSGWSGPLEVYADTGSSPDCGVHFEGPVYDGHALLTPSPATCDCQCEAPTGIQCSAPPLSFFANKTVTAGMCAKGSACATASVTPGTCQHVDVLAACDAGASVAAEFQASQPTGGTCAPVATTAVAPPSWTTNVRACISSLGMAVADCTAGSICAPRTVGLFTNICIAQAGDVACPATPYSVKRLYHQATYDTRDCTPCVCGTPSGAICAAVFQIPAAGSTPCGGASVVEYKTPDACNGFFQQPADVRLVLTQSGGACAPSPVMPTGALLAAQPTTFCCMP